MTWAMAIALPGCVAATSTEPTAIGHVRGRVVGAAGLADPSGRAFVTTGSVSGFSAAPIATEVAAETATTAEAPTLTVRHDFDRVAGPGIAELATRVRRAHPLSEAERYVYLRPGEFFLEDVPAGAASLTASLGTVTSAPVAVVVPGGGTAADITIRLMVPWTPETPPQKSLEAIHVTPSGGVSVTVMPFDGAPPLTFFPNTPVVRVALAAPADGPAVVIAAYGVTYAQHAVRLLV